MKPTKNLKQLNVRKEEKTLSFVEIFIQSWADLSVIVYEKIRKLEPINKNLTLTKIKSNLHKRNSLGLQVALNYPFSRKYCFISEE